MQNIKLSIIIPAYNEKSRIISTLDDVLNYLKSVDYKAEVIVVDDGSTDKTVEIVKRYIQKKKKGKLVNYSKNMGKGYAVKRGMEEAKGDFILYMDADNATSIQEIKKFWQLIENRFDIVIGSRNISSSNTRVARTNSRKWFGVISNWIIRILLNLKFKDTQCGFKLFKEKAGKELFKKQKIFGWGFDFEILALAKRDNFSVKEVPVNWDEKGNSKIRPFADSVKTLIELFKVAIMIRANKY